MFVRVTRRARSCFRVETGTRAVFAAMSRMPRFALHWIAMRIGYARVSRQEQHPEAQHDALRTAGCERVFIDTASGKLARRPELDKALLVARRGDQLVVTKLDRLGRSLEHLIELSHQLEADGVNLVVLDQGIDTSPQSAGCSSRSSAPSPSSNTP